MLDELGSGEVGRPRAGPFAVVGARADLGAAGALGRGVLVAGCPASAGVRSRSRWPWCPGILVAGAVTSAGLSFWRMVLAGDLWTVPGATSDWAAWAPEMLWPLWGVALAVACLAYLGRRTGGVELLAKSRKTLG